MKPIIAGVLTAWVGLAVAGPAAAQTTAVGQVRLDPRPALAAGLAALPRLHAGGPAARRINAALDAIDSRVGAAARSCLADGAASTADPKTVTWQRSVTVPMRGPGYAAFTVADYSYCGGLHPNATTFALVYDLRSGEAVNWQRLLRPLAPRAYLEATMDETPVGVVKSAALTTLYLQAAMPAARRVSAGCEATLRDFPIHFILWPDTRRRGVVLRPFGLAHATAACAVDALIPLPPLRRLGVQPALLDAIAAAHAAGLHGPA